MDPMPRAHSTMRYPKVVCSQMAVDLRGWPDRSGVRVQTGREALPMSSWETAGTGGVQWERGDKNGLAWAVA